MYKLAGKTFHIVPRCSYNISMTVGWFVKEMKHKKIAIALTLTLLLLPITLLKAQETDHSPEEEQIDPAILNMIKSQAMERKREMLNFFGEGPYSPDTENCMQNAQQAMEQAQNFEETNSHGAAQQYIRAMKQYRNALRKHLKENPELLDEFEEPSDTGSASEEIDPSTQQEIDSAKKQLINRFQERYRAQIQAMIENVEELEDDLSPQDAEKARQALMHALEKTLRIQERIQSGEHDNTLDDLVEATESLDQEFEELEDQDAAQMLMSMNRLEARIQKLTQIRNGKNDDEVDTSFEDEILEELEGNKNEMKNTYKEKKGNGSGQGGQGSQGSQGSKGNGSN